MVHGYVVQAIIIIVHVYSVYVKQEGGGIIARSYDKSRNNAPPTLVAYAGLQKRGAYLRDNTVISIIRL